MLESTPECLCAPTEVSIQLVHIKSDDGQFSRFYRAKVLGPNKISADL